VNILAYSHTKVTVIAMTQRLEAIVDGELHVLELPAADEEVIEGVKWGRFDHIFSPAFWFCRVWYRGSQTIVYRLGETLAEEVVACLLGGYGLPAEVGVAAFHRLKERGLLSNSPCAEPRIRAALREPLVVRGRQVYYRYPQQRGHFVAEALNRFGTETAPVHDDLALRDWLLRFKGVGPKTASWITRNFLDSDNVAILDIHIYRAGLLAGVFRADQTVLRDYMVLEGRLVRFARALNVRLAILDTLMWSEMRLMGSFALSALRNRAAA
jgi:N-glycosylase/DNA lyase